MAARHRPRLRAARAAVPVPAAAAPVSAAAVPLAIARTGALQAPVPVQVLDAERPSEPIAPLHRFDFGTRLGQQAFRAERMRVEWEWRLQGHAIADIARMLEERGYGTRSTGAIASDIAKVADARLVHVRAQAERLRTLELARLDRMLAACDGPATSGTDVYAAPIYLRIVEMRSKLLGLDQLPPATPIQDRPLAQLSDQDLAERLARATRVLAGEPFADQ